MSIFSKKIVIPNAYTVEFSFTRIFTVHGLRWFVSAADINLKHIKFYMENTSEGWKIVKGPLVPQWLHEIENDLNKTIQTIKDKKIFEK